MSQAESNARLEQLRTTVAYDDAATADLLIEAAPEELEAKRGTLARLDAVAKPEAVLATTTHVFELDQLGASLQHKASLVGLRLAGTPRLLECERSPESQAGVFATAMKLGKALGRVSVPVSGQVAQRLLARHYREAFFLLEEGALPEDVDSALVEFGFALGPFAALDRGGLGVALAERRARFTRLSPRERACTILEDLASHGRWGQSSGAGFYRYENGQRREDPELGPLLRRHAEDRGLVRRAISAGEITERCVYSVVNEAARGLADGAAARPLDIDMIWLHGYGFPVYRGGPLFFADQVGLGQVLKLVLRYREQVGEAHWAPAPLLERLAASDGTFYTSRG
jgi:3-hydroxyacyl-CoA dehydrogenase